MSVEASAPAAAGSDAGVGTRAVGALEPERIRVRTGTFSRKWVSSPAHRAVQDRLTAVPAVILTVPDSAKERAKRVVLRRAGGDSYSATDGPAQAPHDRAPSTPSPGQSAGDPRPPSGAGRCRR